MVGRFGGAESTLVARFRGLLRPGWPKPRMSSASSPMPMVPVPPLTLVCLNRVKCTGRPRHCHASFFSASSMFFFNDIILATYNLYFIR